MAFDRGSCMKIRRPSVQPVSFFTSTLDIVHRRSVMTSWRPGVMSVPLPAFSTSSTRTLPSARTTATRSEEHTSELQSLMRISYAVFCLKKKKHKIQTHKRRTEYIVHTHNRL